jgi:hypothetical protein
MRHAKAMLNSVIALAVAGCSGGTQGVVNPRCSSMLHITGPVLAVASVTDSVSGASLATVTLSQLKVDGSPADLSLLLQDRQTSNLKLAGGGDALECTIPCGMSSHQGTYSFQVSATGYQALTKSVVARYATVNRGTTAENCAVTLSDGTAVSIALQPQ